MRRLVVVGLCALGAAVVVLARRVLTAPSGAAAPEAAGPVVHTDPEPVARYVALPGVVAVRWVERPRVPRAARDPFPIGPTDLVMTAFVELDPSVWPALDRALGGPLEARTERLDDAWAAAMLPPATLARLPRGDYVRIADERRYDIRSIRKGTRDGDTAWRIGDGLLMSFSTR